MHQKDASSTGTGDAGVAVCQRSCEQSDRGDWVAGAPGSVPLCDMFARSRSSSSSCYLKKRGYTDATRGSASDPLVQEQNLAFTAKCGGATDTSDSWVFDRRVVDVDTP